MDRKVCLLFFMVDHVAWLWGERNRGATGRVARGKVIPAKRRLASRKGSVVTRRFASPECHTPSKSCTEGEANLLRRHPLSALDA